MTDERRSEELATALARMARDLLAQDSLQDTLNSIVAHAVELVDGCEGAGIMVVRKGRVHTLAATGDRARRSDRIQGELGEGPCFDAVCTGTESYLVKDMAEDASRWPRYAPRARELGVGSMLGFKLFTEHENLGALNLYSARAGALTERSEQTGWLLASHAAVAFASARSDADLQGAISTRQDIGVAMGILMERHRISADEAFETLATASQNHNIKLREVARRVAETGLDPAAAAARGQ
jgi:transcriptional regulator with GAF, ATPase, and Fis domain